MKVPRRILKKIALKVSFYVTVLAMLVNISSPALYAVALAVESKEAPKEVVKEPKEEPKEEAEEEEEVNPPEVEDSEESEEEAEKPNEEEAEEPEGNEEDPASEEGVVDEGGEEEGSPSAEALEDKENSSENEQNGQADQSGTEEDANSEEEIVEPINEIGKTEQESSNDESEDEKEIGKWEENKDGSMSIIVEEGEEYEYKDSGFKIEFKEIEDGTGEITVEEIELTDEQVKRLGALSNKAWDITSDMENGTFEYELTLPNEEEVDEDEVKVVYVEDKDDLDDEEKIKEVDKEDVKVDKEKKEIKADDLDHFTAFFVKIYSDASLTLEEDEFRRGETVYVKGEGLSGNKYYKLAVDAPGYDGRTEISDCIYSGDFSELDGLYVLPDDAEISDNWKAELHRFDNLSNCEEGVSSNSSFRNELFSVVSDNQNDSNYLTQAECEENGGRAIICHATSSEVNPYNKLNLPCNAIYGAQGNAGHFNENGTTKAGHEDDVFADENGNCPGDVNPVEDLNLTSVCSDNPDITRRWRVQNTNSFEVEITWEVYGTSQTGTILLPEAGEGEIKYPGATDGANYTFFETDTIEGANTTKIYWYDENNILKDTEKASSGEKCEIKPYCGDGIVNDEDEECDYGEMNGGRGSNCSDECKWVVDCRENLITNGSFENPEVDNDLDWNIFDNHQVSGWTAEWINGSGGDADPQIEIHENALGEASDGNQYIELDSDWDGPGGSTNGEKASIKIYQEIPVIEDYEYKLSWDYSARPNRNNNQLSVEIDDEEIFDSGNIFGGNSIEWKTETKKFTAKDNGLLKISFSEIGNPDSFGMFLDNVRLECLGTETPEYQCNETMYAVNNSSDIFWYDFDENSTKKLDKIDFGSSASADDPFNARTYYISRYVESFLKYYNHDSKTSVDVGKTDIESSFFTKLAFDGYGNLYGLTDDHKLYELDTSDGEATLLGTISGIATGGDIIFDENNTLYLIGTDGKLFTVNPVTLETTLVKATGLKPVTGMAYVKGYFYVSNGSSYVYKMDKNGENIETITDERQESINDLSSCLPGVSAECGDGIKNGQEECDGTDGVEEGQNFCSQSCQLVPIYNGQNECPKGTVKSEKPLLTKTINGDDADGETFSLNGNGKYLFEASGFYVPTSPSGWYADAGYTTTNSWSSASSQYGIQGTGNDYGAHALLADLGDGVGIVKWGEYNSDHVYQKYYEPTSEEIQFVIGDRYGDWFDTNWQNQSGMNDNSGSLDLDVYECVDYGKVLVNKFEDLNKDGKRNWGENAEPDLAGWNFNIYDSENNLIAGSQTTGPNGWTTFKDLMPGDYKICEQMQRGWLNTNPDSYQGHNEGEICRDVTVGPGEEVKNFRFGNYQLGNITIIKDTGSVNAHWLDFGFNSNVGGYESFVLNGGDDPTTNSRTFENLYPGEYVFTETDAPGNWDLTGLTCDSENVVIDKDNKKVTVTLSDSGENVECAFTNERRGQVQITKYEDLNGNGMEDEEEPRLEGWQMFIYESNGNEGWTQIQPREVRTNENGVANYTSLMPNDYLVCEENREAWMNTQPGEEGMIEYDGKICQQVTVGYGDNVPVIFGNKLNPVKIVSHKIVCESEEDLPNWGAVKKNGNPIMENTASEYIEEASGRCWLEEDWQFEYGPKNSGYMGDDFVGVADNGKYQTSNFTNGDGKVEMEITDLSTFNGRIEMREVLKENYLPFTYATEGNKNTNNVSAEFYCGDDVMNYDNWEWINNPQYGETYYCVAWNVEFGEVVVHKFEDDNADGRYDNSEQLLADWEMNIVGDEEYSKDTDDNGKASFTLIPGEYNLSETMQEDWMQSGMYCEGQGEGVMINQPGEAYGHHGQCSGWNGCGNAETCAQWACEIEGYSNLVSYGDAKPCDQLNKCNLFNNRLSLDRNWYNRPGCPVMGVTDVVCSNGISDRISDEASVEINFEQEDYNSLNLEVKSGDYINCYVGNFQQSEMTISKDNDGYEDGAEKPGDLVTYTIKVQALGNGVRNAKVTDLPPETFEYVAGSWTAHSSAHGNINIPEPTYASPGDWELGDMEKDEVITLTYQARVGEETKTGVYPDLAWAQGENLASEKLIALSTDSDFVVNQGVVDENFVGTQIEVENPEAPPTVKVRADKDEVIEEVEEEVKVLGAAFPATGASNNWLLIALIGMLAGGLMICLGYLIKNRRKMKIGKIFGVLAGVIFTGFLAGNAMAAGLSVRVSEPDDKITKAFDLEFVAMDIQDRELIAKCQKKSPSDAGFVQFGADISLKAGGDSDLCPVDSSVLSGNGNYEFRVLIVADGGEEKISNTVTTYYDGVGPRKPEYIEKKDEDGCSNEIKFKTANDGQTAYVEIYRSQHTRDIVANNDSLRKTIVIGPNKTHTFRDGTLATGCGDNYFYAIRAFDDAGNASGVREEVFEEIVEEKEIVEIVENPGGVVLNLETGEDIEGEGETAEGEGSEGEAENAEPIIDEGAQTEGAENETDVLGEQDNDGMNWLGDWRVWLVIVLIAGAGWFVYNKRKEK